jgi:hypothetical protein
MVLEAIVASDTLGYQDALPTKWRRSSREGPGETDDIGRTVRAMDQKASALTTSPPRMVAMAHQVCGAMLSLTNLTVPSMNATSTPPA